MLIDERKVFNMQMRGTMLEIMAIALRMYDKTKKHSYLEDYKWYEEIIKKFK